MSHGDFTSAWMYSFPLPRGPRKPITFWPIVLPRILSAAQMSVANSMFDVRDLRRYCARIRF